MIVRTIGHGQRELPDREGARLDQLDQALMAAIERHDAPAYKRALADVHALVAAHGRPTPDNHFGPSDMILPEPDMTLDEAVALVRHGDLSFPQRNGDPNDHTKR
ncbi:MAG: hypothetical protein M0002_17140 [Rhodospirillales bacterium]|nr:hypothetical protein [Rhodospirillales bacterium]